MSSVIRSFRMEDIESIIEIEATSFLAPWPRIFFIYMHSKAPYLFLVATEGEKVVGYIIGEMRDVKYSSVPHRLRVGHILNIAVNSGKRLRGIGAHLMDEIEGRFAGENASKITLEVRESNDGARLFYQRQGFVEIGRIKDYYLDEDAVVMSKTIQVN